MVATVTDILLFYLFFGFRLSGPPTSRTAWRAIYAAERDLRHVNYETLKNVFYQLKKRGFIHTLKKELYLDTKITEEGRQRLQSLLPVYNTKRTWDGRIYLITYDIPEKRKRTRDILRENLERIGCGMLQASVWITPYDPREILEEFAKEYKLKDLILVSDVGKDGSIGQMTIEELIGKVYKAEEVNNSYYEFLNKHEQKKATKLGPEDLSKISFDYFWRLKKDPQLPFELLPEDWAGKQAYLLYRRLVPRKVSSLITI